MMEIQKVMFKIDFVELPLIVMAGKIKGILIEIEKPGISVGEKSGSILGMNVIA